MMHDARHATSNTVIQRRFNADPGHRSTTHPAGHRRRPRGPELPGPLRRRAAGRVTGRAGGAQVARTGKAGGARSGRDAPPAARAHRRGTGRGSGRSRPVRRFRTTARDRCPASRTGLDTRSRAFNSGTRTMLQSEIEAALVDPEREAPDLEGVPGWPTTATSTSWSSTRRPVAPRS